MRQWWIMAAAWVVLAAGVPLVPAVGGIDIEQILFQAAHPSSTYDDSSDDDRGGAMFVYVRNTDAAACTLTQVKLNGTALDSVVDTGQREWWRYLPETIPPYGRSCITVKMLDAPVRDGQNVTVWVQSSSGATDSLSTTLSEEKLRLGSIVPSPDYRTVYLFVRNLDSINYTITEVHLNDNVTGLCTFVGDAVVTPGEQVGIIKVTFPVPVEPMTFWAVKLRAVKPGGAAVWIGAPYRLTPPWMPVGSWSGSLMEAANEDDQQYIRSIMFNANTGSANYNDINEGGYKYFIKNLPLENDVADIAANRGNPNIAAWFLGDEPDVAANDVVPLLEEARNCWLHDPTHPTYLNMAKNNRFGEYGQIVDIVGMDHYIMYAPNALGALAGHFDELPAYMEALKLTCEPKPMWCWPQLAAGTWGDHQPERWGIDVQFWTHVALGAKGFMWFDYGPGMQDDYPDQFAEADQTAQRLTQVRGLVQYGETADIVSTSTGAVLARAIVGTDALVLVICNYNISDWLDFGHWHLHYDQEPVSGWAEVTVPVWIDLDRVTEIHATSPTTPSYTVNGRTVRINFNIDEDSLVYIIGKEDTEPPAQPVGVHVAQAITDSAVVLSWDDTFDNYGVRLYRIIKNGQTYGTSKTAIFRDDNAAPGDVYQVKAIDAAGNASPLSKPFTRGQLSWNFERPADFEGVIIPGNAVDISGADGVLGCGINGHPLWIYSPYSLQLDAATHRWLRVRMRNGSDADQARFLWQRTGETTWASARAKWFTVTPHDTGFTEYIADLTSKPDWSGTISRVRFCPAYRNTVSGLNTTAGRVEIDYVIVQGTAPLVPGDTNGNGHVDLHDFAGMTSGWMEDWTGWESGNFDGDDVTGYADMKIQADHWLD